MTNAVSVISFVASHLAATGIAESLNIEIAVLVVPFVGELLPLS